MFYFFFEVSLVIVYIIIMKWGLGVMRLISSYYFMFYTLFFSLPLLVFIFYLSYEYNSSMMLILELGNVYMSCFMYMYMCMGFLLKIPMYLFHGWLLKAHVEAPVFGSMVLASLLLKLGTYGMLQFLMIFYLNSVYVSSYLLTFSVIGSIYISCVCLRQVDMKVLVAYSSVVHMGLLLGGMFTLMKLGFVGSYILMISHGLCSSGLFYLVNVFYKETNSRLILVNKGLLIYMPSMSMLWFFLCSSNMASPVSLNLVGEVLLMISLIVWMKFIFVFLVFYGFFSFAYSLYMYSCVFHGESNFLLGMSSGLIIDYFILLIHWIPLNFLFLNLVHAMFKSLMFLCVGGFIHSMNDNQDIRNYGGTFYVYPFKSMIMIISLFCLCGMPFLSGFYSKDLIFEYFLVSYMNLFLMIMFYLYMIFTVSYSVRLVIWLFLDCYNFLPFSNLKESWLISVSMIILMLMSIFCGFFFSSLIYMKYFIMLMSFDKILILKMYLCALLMGWMFYLNNMMNYLCYIYFFVSMYFLNVFFKLFYKNFILSFFSYQSWFEKGWYESLSGLSICKFMYLVNFLDIKRFSFILIVKIYIYMYLLLMIIY